MENQEFKVLTLKQRENTAVTMKASIEKIFDARNIQTATDVILLYNTKAKLNDLTDLTMCKVFRDCKNKALWQNDESTRQNGFKSFESWARFHFGLEKASIENYVFIGRFTDESGKMDILPKLEEDKEKSYLYTALLEIARLCGKDIPKGTREEKESERYTRMLYLAENGFIRPTMVTKKEVSQAVQKGLLTYLGKDITDEVKTDEVKTDDLSLESQARLLLVNLTKTMKALLVNVCPENLEDCTTLLNNSISTLASLIDEITQDKKDEEQ